MPSTAADVAAGITVQACDRDIIAGLQKLKAFALQHAGEVRWCVADAALCGAALEHLLLTCIEKGISLGAFQASEIVDALQAASDDLSCAPTSDWHIA